MLISVYPKYGDHPHIKVLFPFRMPKKRFWKPKRSRGGPVAHAALSWWPRGRNPARLWVPRTARSCWERRGKCLWGKSSPQPRPCPAPARRDGHPRDREHPERQPWRGGSSARPCPSSSSGCIPQHPLRSPAASGAARRILGSFLGLQRPLLRHGLN